MICIQNIKKSFGTKVACDIESLQIHEGEIIGLVGNNGAGKTTLFRILLDLLKPDNGEVTLKGINVQESEEWKNFTGAYINEQFLIDYLTPEEFFELLAKISGISKDEMKHRLEMFETFDNGELLGNGKLIRNMSAGNKQKIGIISALLTNPKLVILDEPFNFLDPRSQNVIKNILLEYGAKHNATIIISSHNLTHTIDISSRILLLENGKVIKDLNKQENWNVQELEDYFSTAE